MALFFLFSIAILIMNTSILLLIKCSRPYYLETSELEAIASVSSYDSGAQCEIILHANLANFLAYCSSKL
jgi:hypothetical protein